MLKIVVLPQPDGPIRLTKRPAGMSSVDGRERDEIAALAGERHRQIFKTQFSAASSQGALLGPLQDCRMATQESCHSN